MIVNKVICGPYVMILENNTGYSAAKKAEKLIIVRIKYTNILKFSKMDIIASDAIKNTKWGHMVKTKTKGLLSIKYTQNKVYPPPNL